MPTEYFKNKQQNKQPRFTAIIQVNLRYPAPRVKNWRILLVQSFTARMPLLAATSLFRLGRTLHSSPQRFSVPYN